MTSHPTDPPDFDLAHFEADLSQISAIPNDVPPRTGFDGETASREHQTEVLNSYETRLARAKLRQAELKDKHQVVTRESTTLVAWCPSGIDQELGAVLIRRGQVTESQWWHALSDRVTRLALHEPDPVKAVKWATNLVENQTFGAVATTTDPQQAGAYLVEGNWQLREQLCSWMNRYETSFPSEAVTDDLDVREVMEGTNLEQWVNLAIAYSSSSGMD